MNVTRSIVGGLAAAGLVLGLGSAAGACPGGDDYEHEDYKDYDEDKYDQDSQWKASHVGNVHAPNTVHDFDYDAELEGVIINTFSDED